MPRRAHYAESSHSEITDVIASFVGESSPLIEWERKVERFKVNGIRIGERRSALRRPDQPLLAEPYHNAFMTADILLSLGDEPTDVVDILTCQPPLPDLEIRFLDGRSVYGEFSRLCEESHEGVDDLTYRVDAKLKQAARDDDALRAVLSTNSPHFTFHLAPVELPSPTVLLTELHRFICAGAGPPHPDSQPVEAAYDALSTLGTTYWWSGGAWIGGNFVRFERPQLSVEALMAKTTARMRAKRDKRYRESPLWLLMPISESWRDASRLFLNAIAAGEVKFNASGFDDVIVGVTGRAISLVNTERVRG
jgi:hypothetical protein